MNNILIDTHAHLTWESFKEDLDQVIDRAALVGVKTIINIGADLQSSKLAAELNSDKVKFYSTIGLHPDEVLSSKGRSASGRKLPEIEELQKIYLSNPSKVVAVGECGLDYFQEGSEGIEGIEGIEELEKVKTGQMELFQAQISLAKKLNLPLIIHCREAWEDIPWDNLKGLKVVFHYFTGSQEVAQKIIDEGFYLSFSCVVTYPKNENLREIIKITPLDKILTETDSPFSPPQTKRGQRNEPANVFEVVKTIAQVKNLSFEAVAANTLENASKLFQLGEVRV